MILGEARGARASRRAMFVAFYVSIVALVIARVLPVASLLVVAVVPGPAADVEGVLGAEARRVSPMPNPVWPLWFAALSFLVTRRAGRAASCSA